MQPAVDLLFVHYLLVVALVGYTFVYFGTSVVASLFADLCFDVAYLSEYKAKVEGELLTLEGNDLFFQLTIHPNVTKDTFEQNKNVLKQTLTGSGYVIKSEETTIRNGIEFYLIKMTNFIDDTEENYEYYLATENNNLFEILVYELKDGNYTKVSKQLRTIVKETKISN